jgi:hypothetical protein
MREDVLNYLTLLIAVCDRNKAAGLGGTADYVNYAVRRQAKMMHLNPITREITETGGWLRCKNYFEA